MLLNPCAFTHRHWVSECREVLAILPVSQHTRQTPMKHPVILLACLGLFAPGVLAAGRKAHPSRPDPRLPSPSATDLPAPETIYTSNLGGRDLRFLTDGIEHGLAQLWLAELAGTRAQGERVKAVSALLAQTQRDENAKLARLAAMKSVAPRTKEAVASPALAEKFATLKPEMFDAVWIAEVTAINQKAVANYTLGAQSGDIDIKGFAEKALPLAKEKLTLVSGSDGTVPAAPKSKRR